MTAPLVQQLVLTAPAVGATASDANPIGVAPYAAAVTSVQYIPKAAATGASGNNRAFQVINRGAAGTGTTVVASATLVSGTNLASKVPFTLTLATAANLVLASGDVLDFASAPNGSGLADPGGSLVVKFSRS